MVWKLRFYPLRLIKAFGGDEKFEAKLDEMFNAPSATTGREQVDVTGLIGQYAHGNEPSHHMAYLYNYVGKPEKTKEKVHYILDEFYKNTPDGLIGNEDCGQMSAWYVLSSLGIYDVTPGDNYWQKTEPYFDKAKINFEDGTSAIIRKSEYKNDLKVFDPAEGVQTKPYKEIIPVPVIDADGKSFENEMKVALQAPFGGDVYFSMYNTGEEKLDAIYNLYEKPIIINKSTIIELYTFDDERQEESNTISATFFKKPNNYTVDVKSKYNRQYHAGGPGGLIDGIKGNENWRKGDWQGYQGQNFEAVIDLQKQMPVTSVEARFLQDSRSWILMPAKVEYYISNDNKSFTLLKTIENTINPQQEGSIIETFKAQLKDTNARYIKVKAYNFGTLPQWHQGAGGEAFIFVDEITVVP